MPATIATGASRKAPNTLVSGCSGIAGANLAAATRGTTASRMPVAPITKGVQPLIPTVSSITGPMAKPLKSATA